jgi:hypothetical protein
MPTMPLSSNLEKGIFSVTCALALTLAAASDINAQVESVNENGNVTIAEFVADPEALDGQIITIRGQVSERLGDSLFVITGGPNVVDQNVLVINASGEPFTAPTGNNILVQATGDAVYPFNANLAAAYRLSPDYEAFTEYGDAPVVVAESLVAAPLPVAILENPDQFLDHQVAVQGQVSRVYEGKAFTLEAGADNQLLVVGEELDLLDVGQEFVITGTVTPLVIGTLDRNHLSIDNLNLINELESEFAERPVLRVNEITPASDLRQP